MSDVLAKKDAKISSLIAQANKAKFDGKKMNIAAAKLIEERAEADELLGQLRDVVSQFDSELGDLHAENHQLESAVSEAAQLRAQVAILTRALAIMEEGTECARCGLGEAWGEQVRDEMQTQLDAKQAETEAALDELAAERVAVERMGSENRWLEAEIARLGNEREVMAGELIAAREYRSEAEELKREARETLGDISELRAAISKLESELAQKRKEIDLAESRNRETLEESELLRNNIGELDAEIRGLAFSLAAESESNGNLAARLSKTEHALVSALEEVKTLKAQNSKHNELKTQWEKETRENELLRQKNQTLRHELGTQEGAVARAVSKNDMLETEIARLNQQLHVALTNTENAISNVLAVTREKDKIKSLLAADTMNRLGRILQ